MSIDLSMAVSLSLSAGNSCLRDSRDKITELRASSANFKFSTSVFQTFASVLVLVLKFIQIAVVATKLPSLNNADKPRGGGRG